MDSYSVRLAYIRVAGPGDAALLCVLQRPREVLKRGHVVPVKRKWKLPGGEVERNETLDEALCWEIREETGVFITGQDLCALRHRLTHKPSRRPGFLRHHERYSLLVKHYVPEAAFAGTEEIEAAKWFPLSELPITGNEANALDAGFSPGNLERLIALLEENRQLLAAAHIEESFDELLGRISPANPRFALSA